MSSASAVNGIVTAQAPDNPAQIWRYREDAPQPFDPVVFDITELRERGLVTGVPDGGRGGTVFFELDGVPLVLREYRRGGLVQHISTRAYVQSGLERSRAMREFAVLLELEAIALPVPVVFAARRTRHGLVETGELVTHRLKGTSLARCFIDGTVDDNTWQAVGRCIAHFHRHGVEHADLNAHNILIDDGSDRVQLLDFDKGRIHPQSEVNSATPWARKNLDRLARSLERVGAAQAAPQVMSAWEASLAEGSPSASR